MRAVARRCLVWLVAGLFCLPAGPVAACTGITLKAADGAKLYGRTMEWGTFDLLSRLVLVPRGFRFTAKLDNGQAGKSWQGKYGVIGLDGLQKDIILDGMNERSLTVGLFYHPDYAEYQKFVPADAAESLGPTDVGAYLLTTCASVAEARATLEKTRVVAVVEPALGFSPPVHYFVSDASGAAIVIEFLNGEMKVFDSPLGVITNSPNYDWHETNLRNYINLSPVALPTKKLADLNFAPLGGGSGMIGLPGDFTPPSRFVRAVAFTQSARPTKTGEETIYELFRILDNFNVPLGGSEGPVESLPPNLRSSTLWTSGYDKKNRLMYYHTQNNRRVRKVDLNKIDFANQHSWLRMPLDRVKEQDYEDRTPH